MYAAKITAFKIQMQKKQLFYGELLGNVQTLMAYNDQVVKNEEDKLKLRVDIDTSIIELEQLRTLARELSDQLEHKRGTYKGLKSDIRTLDLKADDLKQ